MSRNLPFAEVLFPEEVEADADFSLTDTPEAVLVNRINEIKQTNHWRETVSELEEFSATHHWRNPVVVF